MICLPKCSLFVLQKNNLFFYSSNPLKTAICTISTQSHIFKSKALHHSLLPFFDGDFCCLVTDARALSWGNDAIIHDLDFLSDESAVALKKKYTDDKLRWSLKPVYLKFLLELGYDHVIYVDNDIFFYSSPDFLFEKLRTASFLVTPHFYKADPTNDQHWLEANFRVGLYNAGFIGVSHNGIPILDWWANCCLYNVKKAYWRGLFDDQKYLDLVPVLFDDVEILKHKGCNLAGWNYQNYSISRNAENHLLLNGDPLVFIHFADLSMREFAAKECLIHQEFNDYLLALKMMNSSWELNTSKFERRNLRSFFYYLRWRLVRLFDQ